MFNVEDNKEHYASQKKTAKGLKEEIFPSNSSQRVNQTLHHLPWKETPYLGTAKTKSPLSMNGNRNPWCYARGNLQKFLATKGTIK
jgi:hypothetical protein